MDETVQLVYDTTEESMKGSLSHLEKALARIRAGKASPMMLSTVKVDYYGSLTPLSQVANINTPDARTLAVQPWEKNMIGPIEKAITYANLGFNPMNNGEMVIINVPPLTEERRKELAKQAKGEAEDAKISIRSARQEANKELKGLALSEDILSNAEVAIQAFTNTHIKKVDAMLAVKEAEIMKV